ncbi:MAG: hypothetical protein ACI8WB_005805 [Phenylobacterium sp.]
MKTQTRLTRTTPVLQVLQEVDEKIPVVAVMTAGDETGKLNFSTEMVFALERLGKHATLINAIDTHISIDAIARADILIIDCPSGLQAACIEVANMANIVVVTQSAGLTQQPGHEPLHELLQGLYHNSHYNKPFEIVVSHASDENMGLESFHQLVEVVGPGSGLLVNLLCLLCDDTDLSHQRGTLHQAAVRIMHWLF